MFKAIPVMLTFLLLAACSTTPADTRTWTQVTCHGFVGWEGCYAKAARLCQEGYDSASKEENLVTQNRSMKVACKK